MFTITRQELGSGRYSYTGQGQLNGEDLTGLLLIASSKVCYSWASLTPIPHEGETRQVLSFHKSQTAAAKGNSDLRKWATGPIQVLEIGGQS